MVAIAGGDCGPSDSAEVGGGSVGRMAERRDRRVPVRCGGRLPSPGLGSADATDALASSVEPPGDVRACPSPTRLAGAAYGAGGNETAQAPPVVGVSAARLGPGVAERTKAAVLNRAVGVPALSVVVSADQEGVSLTLTQPTAYPRCFRGQSAPTTLGRRADLCFMSGWAYLPA